METGTWQSFQDFSLWHLVVAWCRSAESKVLEVEHNGKHRTLHLCDGSLVAATSQEPSENLAQVFLDDTIFNLEQYFKASSGFDEERSLSDNLLASGLVTPSEVVIGEQECMFRILRGSLLVDEGRFRTMDLPDSEGPRESTIRLMPALFRAFLEFEDRDWVLRQYDQHLHIGLQQSDPFPEELWETPGLEPLQAVAEKCQEGILFRELVSHVALPDFTLLKFVWIATQFGFLSRSMLLEAEPDSLPAQQMNVEEVSEDSSVTISSDSSQSNLPRFTKAWLWWSLVLVLLVAAGSWYVFVHMPASASKTAVTSRETPGAEALAEEPQPEISDPDPMPPDPVLPESFQHQGQQAMAAGDIKAASSFWKDASLNWQNHFTLGIYMACDSENVFSLWRELKGDQQFFVIPKAYQDSTCYWVCWGQFASRSEALAARGSLPETLKKVAPDAEAYAIEKLY